MTVTIPTKTVENVRDVYRKECGYSWQLEDGIEEFIKREMGVGE